MPQEKSYLEGLKYDPALEKHLIAKYLLNFRFVFLLIITILALGIFSFINLPRRLNPEVKIPIVSVTTFLPGAGPADVESLVTIPIEDEIISLENVKTITSSSTENLSLVSVEFESGTDPDRAKDSVQSAADGVGDLPQDAETPRVQKLDFENQPVWTFLVSASKDDASLSSFSENLEDKIDKVPTIKSIQVAGMEEQEIQIIVERNIGREFNIDPLSLQGALRSALNSQPAGIINTETSSFALTLDPTVASVEELRNLRINTNGQVVRLGDIATVQINTKVNSAKTYFANSNTPATRGVVFSVFKTESANIDQAVEDTRKVTEEEVKNYNNEFSVTSVLDASELIDEQFSDLTESFVLTIILVLITLFIFLGIRQALIVAFAIPLSFLVAFFVMDTIGLTLNFLSLFSLILALGLLVDDAIVVVTAVTAYWRSRRFTPNQTGLLVLRDFIIPIWSTTITAVWAFLPLLIASGIIGEFIKSISIVVSATLIASTGIAILITLPLMVVLLKPDFPNRVSILIHLLVFALILGAVIILTLNSPLLFLNIIATILLIFVAFKLKRELSLAFWQFTDKFTDSRKLKQSLGKYAGNGIIDSHKLSLDYQRLITRILNSRSAQNKTLIVVVMFSLFSYLLVPLGLVKNEFFPKTNIDTLYVQLELPSGTNLQTSQQQAEKLSNELRDTKDLEFLTTEIGRTISTVDFFDTSGNTNNILSTLVLTKETSIETAEQLRKDFKNYSVGKVSVVEQTGGPPAGADLQIKLSGEDLAALDSYANQIVSFLENEQTTTTVDKSIKSGTSKVVFVPDRNKMASYNLSEATLGQSLRIFASGFTLDSDVKFDGQTYDIVFRNNPKIESVQNLGTVTVQTQQGQIPLSAIGSFRLEANPTRISREDQKRTISVSAGLKQGYTAPTENKKLEDFANSLNLPSGYTWKTGGVNEENQESVNSILKAMIIAAILITATMVLQFGSYRKAIIVLLKIPIAISGVFIVFALTATPLSFPTLIGILALFGITVYQSMLIVDKINRNITAKMNLKHAIADASASRVEPILFGTICTVVGLIPITLSDPLWRGLGGAIIAGLLFSGVIMLLFIPVVYYKLYKGEIK